MTFWLHGCIGEWEGGPVNQVNHNSWVAVVTPPDRPKSVRNCCLIELFVALFVLSLCPFDISVGVGAFVIGLGHIFSFLSQYLCEGRLKLVDRSLANNFAHNSMQAAILKSCMSKNSPFINGHFHARILFPQSFSCKFVNIYQNITSYVYGKQIKSMLGNKLFYECVHLNKLNLPDCPTMTLA